MDIEHKHFQIIDSTNNWAKANAHLLPKDKITLVTANEQTAGRGRFKRLWESPGGLNIYATFCFFIEKHRLDIGNIPQVLAISAARSLEELGHVPRLKWPNDVLLSGKKVAGILCETTPFSDTLCIALGIGLNVNMPLVLLQKIDRPATSLLVENGRLHEPNYVLEVLQKYFLKDLELFFDEGFISFLEMYRGYMAHNEGDRIRFHDNRVIWEGRFHSINTDGSLTLLLDNDELKKFIAGEILFESV